MRKNMKITDILRCVVGGSSLQGFFQSNRKEEKVLSQFFSLHEKRRKECRTKEGNVFLF